jgi:hypothetical protein
VHGMACAAVGSTIVVSGGVISSPAAAAAAAYSESAAAYRPPPHCSREPRPSRAARAGAPPAGCTGAGELWRGAAVLSLLDLEGDCHLESSLAQGHWLHRCVRGANHHICSSQLCLTAALSGSLSSCGSQGGAGHVAAEACVSTLCATSSANDQLAC